jgi:hypothetical protein
MDSHDQRERLRFRTVRTRVDYDEFELAWFVLTSNDGLGWHRLNVRFNTEQDAAVVARVIKRRQAR